MNPTAVETYRVLALAFAQQGQWAEAERATREGMALAAAGPYTMATLGYVLARASTRSEEHTSELQSQSNLVCRLLLEKKKKKRSKRAASLYYANKQLDCRSVLRAA